MAQRALLPSNSPGLPPMDEIDQAHAYATCTSIVTPLGTKTLSTRKQYIIAGAWPANLPDATIQTLENGMSLPSTGACNSRFANGLNYDNNVMPADPETLPATSGSGGRMVRTGSLATVNCISRYGIRDLAGNLWEWSSDQLANCSAATHTCDGVVSPLDASNTDFAQFQFDGMEGPGAGTTDITEWLWTDENFSSTQIYVPLGLPVVTTAPASFGATPIGIGAGEFNPTQFDGNFFWLHTDNGNPTRGTLTGASFTDGTRIGRYATYFAANPTDLYTSVGLRCVLPAE